jgi:Family of unknown function (DUF5693)
MIKTIGKTILIILITIGVLVGAYLGYTRYFVEIQERTVELCVDLNDLKRMANFENKPLGPILDEVKKRGIVSVGVFEETLPDANSLGEIYYTSGSGAMRIKLNPLYCKLGKKGLIKTGRTYIYSPNALARKRIYKQLSWMLTPNNLKFYGNKILEVNESESEIRDLGLGISEVQKKFIYSKGLRIIPRIWNDGRYHLGNIPLKIAALKEYDTIIFDGEEIVGYPKALKSTADGMKKNKIRYGYIEIVKQDGDKALKKMMGEQIVRVHSVPKEELKKISKRTAVRRFVRAARERKVKLIYLRPFLPPELDTYPVAYNLNYFSEVKDALEKSGFVLGKAELTYPLKAANWQILVLGIAVMVGLIFLLNYFITIPVALMFLFLIMAAGGIHVGLGAGYCTLIQKALALLTAIVFPALAVISSFASIKEKGFSLPKAIFAVLNIVGEAMIGVFLIFGLLADYRFMIGIETFSGVKIALLLPIMIVALYFILKQGEGSFTNRVRSFLNIDVKLFAILGGLGMLGGLFILVARSGNFVLPVPAFETIFRNFLEVVFIIRPRTKEFLIGYPLLFLAITMFMRNKKKWVWIPAAIGTIAPISMINTFCHIHTPIIVSMIRTINGLTLGIIIGCVVAFVTNKLIRE